MKEQQPCFIPSTASAHSLIVFYIFLCLYVKQKSSFLVQLVLDVLHPPVQTENPEYYVLLHFTDLHFVNISIKKSLIPFRRHVVQDVLNISCVQIKPQHRKSRPQQSQCGNKDKHLLSNPAGKNKKHHLYI